MYPYVDPRLISVINYAMAPGALTSKQLLPQSAKRIGFRLSSDDTTAAYFATGGAIIAGTTTAAIGPDIAQLNANAGIGEWWIWQFGMLFVQQSVWAETVGATASVFAQSIEYGGDIMALLEMIGRGSGH